MVVHISGKLFANTVFTGIMKLVMSAQLVNMSNVAAKNVVGQKDLEFGNMDKWYKRLWAPALCWALWLGAVLIFPFYIAFPIMIACAVVGGGSIIYVFTGGN